MLYFENESWMLDRYESNHFKDHRMEVKIISGCYFWLFLIRPRRRLRYAGQIGGWMSSFLLFCFFIFIKDIKDRAIYLYA